ncbi:DMT family transporter [Acinetobacter sp. MB5]|uniref:DMT family transporter n=1 Tax=Acinetobacter sp. MB5 TaxID=2069438 RepID=UPI000DD063CD|nr:DMT family transporter [Acinetobacter sp. MB5]
MSQTTQKKIFFILAPWIFVFLWSTGFVGAKFTVQYSEPFHLLFLRGAFSCVAFFILAMFLKVKFPSGHGIVKQLIVGLFLHTFFLGGCFFAMKKGIPSGVVALITGLQPVVTAIIVSTFQHTHLSRTKWLGIFIGFLGVFFVLSPGGKSFDMNLTGLFAAFVGLAGVTIGSLYQKNASGDGHIIGATFFQYVTLTVVMGILSFFFESSPVHWNLSFVLGLTWLVLGVSVTAVLLLIYMIQNGEATKVATYFYLVPVLTAIEAWALFDEAISMAMLTGMTLSIIGLLLVIRKERNLESIEKTT